MFAISFQRRRRCCISCRRRVWSALFGAQRTSTIRRRRLVSCKRNPADATEKKQAKLPPPPLPGKRERERGRSVFCASFGSVRILAGRGAFLLLLLHSFLRSAQTCRATQKPRDGDTKLKKTQQQLPLREFNSRKRRAPQRSNLRRDERRETTNKRDAAAADVEMRLVPSKATNRLDLLHSTRCD